jgi:hypothetical protein
MLLSYKFKLPGLVLIFAGTVLTFFYFGLDFRFEIPVLALFSSFMETRFFTIFRTNFADELIMLLFLSGLFLLAFSADKHELDSYKSLRIKALIKTVVADSIFIILSLLFVYGSGFLAVAIMNFFLPFILYLVIFNILKKRAQVNYD